MDADPDAVELDAGDFDAIGVMTDVVLALRGHTMDRQVDAVATVSAPAGRHVLRLTARPGGHAVLSVRFDDLTTSRRNVLTTALAGQGWDADEDGEGASRRYPPGTDATAVAFEALSVLTIGGAPADVRTIVARDAGGTPLPLRS